MTAPHPDPVTALAEEISLGGVVVTWLNHWSIQHAQWGALRRVDHIGIDGTLLQLMLARSGMAVGRTSADLVLPVLFRDYLAPGTPIALIGAAPGVAAQAATRITGHEVACFDGYEDLTQLRHDPTRLVEFGPAVIVLGLGAGLQDQVAAEFHELFPEAIICTAGGFIDQLAKDEQYFPPWVHRYRLGWAWRIAHEPRRLLRRYTLDAVVFLARFRELKGKLGELGVRPTFTSLRLSH